MWGAQSGGQKNNQFRPARGHEWETIFDRAIAKGRERDLLQLRHPLLRPLRGPRADLDQAGRTTTTSTPPQGTLSNINFVDPALTAAPVMASPETSTPTATSASARPSCPTSSTPSWPRRSGSAARCSSSMTSGEGSSTTCRRAVVPDDRASTRPVRELRASPASASRPWWCRPSCARGSVSHATDHVRVDPEADLLQVQPRLPEQAPPLRLQHRAHLRLEQPGLRAAEPADPQTVAERSCSSQGFRSAEAPAREKDTI